MGSSLLAGSPFLSKRGLPICLAQRVTVQQSVFLPSSVSRRACLGAFVLALFLALGWNKSASAQGTLMELGATQSAAESLGAKGAARAAANDPANIQATDPNVAVPADPNAAAPAPAATGVDKWDDAHSIPRLKEPSLNKWKWIGLAVLALLWARTSDWINYASQVFDLGYGTWNSITMFSFIAAGALVLLVPNFVVTSIIAVLAWLVPLIAFIVVHNKAVPLHHKVLTADWFRHEIALAGSKIGLKLNAERVADYDKGAKVDLIALGGADQTVNQANLLTARQSPGYLLVKDLVAEMSNRRSIRALLDYSADAVTTRHLIDGVWHEGDTKDRESGDVMLAVMKTLANLNVKERRAKQSGLFAANYENNKYKCPIVCQGVKTGERVIVDLTGGQRAEYKTLESLGMREKLREQWSNMMLATGVVVISAPKEGGLTTLTNVSLIETDRLMRDIVAIEDVHAPEKEIENVEQVFFDPQKGESPATLMPRLVRKYPDLYVCRDFVNEESAKALVTEAKDEKLVVTTVNANEAPEALLRILLKKAPQREFAECVVGAINMRLIRLLCDDCKVGYEPGPDMLKKLGIPAGKVTQFFRVPKPEEANKPCPKCQGVGFYGRTGLFEVLEANDQVREVLIKKPELELLRKAARNAGMRTLQEEGILLVAKGVTSLPELSRVLKGAT